MKPSNDVQKLHSEGNDHFMARLHIELLAMRSLTGQVSTPIEKSAGSAPVPTDAAGLVDAGSDIGNGEK